MCSPAVSHEMMAVPESAAQDWDLMRGIVRRINDTVVREEEILSDSVYFYDRKEDKLLEVR